MSHLTLHELENNQEFIPSLDLVSCPRYNKQIEEIIWEMTNCPRCRLHLNCY